eukprot:scaffold8106_cov107-Isochrysis_galbana.AAC.16
MMGQWLQRHGRHPIPTPRHVLFTKKSLEESATHWRPLGRSRGPEHWIARWKIRLFWFGSHRVGERELDRYFGEGENDLLAVLSFELFRAVGGRKNGPWTLLAVVENVGLGVHPLEVEEKIGDCGAHVRVADLLAERGALLLDVVMRLLVSETKFGSSPSSIVSSSMGGGGGGALPLPF